MYYAALSTALLIGQCQRVVIEMGLGSAWGLSVISQYVILLMKTRAHIRTHTGENLNTSETRCTRYSCQLAVEFRVYSKKSIHSIARFLSKSFLHIAGNLSIAILLHCSGSDFG